MVELEDRWELPFRGRVVSYLQVSFALSMSLEDGRDDHVWIVIEGVATLDRPESSGPVLMDPGQQDVAPALKLFRKMVTSATAFKNGRLLVEFDGDVRLVVDPDPDCEAWHFVGPGDLRTVCMPGGALAIWS